MTMLSMYSNIKTTPKMLAADSAQSCQQTREPTASIFVEFNPGKNIPADALVDYISALPHVAAISIVNGMVVLADKSEIELQPGVYGKMYVNELNDRVSKSSIATQSAASENDELCVRHPVSFAGINVYSRTLNMVEIGRASCRERV